MSTPSRATQDGLAYLDLRKKAREDRRPVDEPRPLQRGSRSQASKRQTLVGNSDVH